MRGFAYYPEANQLGNIPTLGPVSWLTFNYVCNAFPCVLPQWRRCSISGLQ
jgi:hypothetical protein